MSEELRYCTILKTRINVTNMEDALDYIMVHQKELSGNYICISNVHTTVLSFRDEEYRHIQNSAAMALPDGKPLSMVSRKRGFPEAERVPGPDMMPKLLQRSEEEGYRHFFSHVAPYMDCMKELLLQQRPASDVMGYVVNADEE